MTGHGKSNALKQIISQDLQDPEERHDRHGAGAGVVSRPVTLHPKERRMISSTSTRWINVIRSSGSIPLPLRRSSTHRKTSVGIALQGRGSNHGTHACFRADGCLDGAPRLRDCTRVTLVPNASLNDIPRFLDPAGQRLRLLIAGLPDAPNRPADSSGPSSKTASITSARRKLC